MTSPIPIQNLYYLFSYAWKHYRDGRQVDVGRVENPTAPNLFATVVTNGTRHLLRRGLDRGYVAVEEDLSCLRGRIEISETVKRNLQLTARAHCRFDEFLTDVPQNQILKWAMKTLSQVKDVDLDRRKELRMLIRNFDQVSDIRVDRQLFRGVRIHRNNRFYAFLMRVCELVHDSLLPESDREGTRFPDILNDTDRMGMVFEEFVRNYFDAEQRTFAVKCDRIEWDAQFPVPEDKDRLPGMKTPFSALCSLHHFKHLYPIHPVSVFTMR